jgi:hypothetical protein
VGNRAVVSLCERALQLEGPCEKALNVVANADEYEVRGEPRSGATRQAGCLYWSLLLRVRSIQLV